MRNVALDLGGRRIDYCEVSGEVVIARGMVKELAGIRAVLDGGTAPAYVAFEACREGWHAAKLIEEWGHVPVMVDTTRAKQLGIGQHGRKTNRIDAEVLARALEARRLPLAHILSPAAQELRFELSARRMLVEMRARSVGTIRGVARARGERIGRCDVWDFRKKLAGAALSEQTRALIAPMLPLIEDLERGIVTVESRLEHLNGRDPQLDRLMTVPGVSQIVASAFVSVIDEARRFRNAHQVASYLGLVPSEDSTGNKRRIGSITKEGNSYLRALLVQAAWCLLRGRSRDPLARWAKQVARRRGKRIAVVALARRLAGLLWAMWRDQTVYDPEHRAGSLAGCIQSESFQAKALDRAANKGARHKRRALRAVASI